MIFSFQPFPTSHLVKTCPFSCTRTPLSPSDKDTFHWPSGGFLLRSRKKTSATFAQKKPKPSTSENCEILGCFSSWFLPLKQCSPSVPLVKLWLHGTKKSALVFTRIGRLWPSKPSTWRGWSFSHLLAHTWAPNTELGAKFLIAKNNHVWIVLESYFLQNFKWQNLPSIPIPQPQLPKSFLVGGVGASTHLNINQIGSSPPNRVPMKHVSNHNRVYFWKPTKTQQNPHKKPASVEFNNPQTEPWWLSQYHHTWRVLTNGRSSQPPRRRAWGRGRPYWRNDGGSYWDLGGVEVVIQSGKMGNFHPPKKFAKIHHFIFFCEIREVHHLEFKTFWWMIHAMLLRATGLGLWPRDYRKLWSQERWSCFFGYHAWTLLRGSPHDF